MFKFKHRYVKVHMAQYLSGDLPDITRRRVARFIDECQDCYDEFLRQRSITDQLQRNLPSLGRPDDQRLNSIWLSLQTELAPVSGPAIFDNARMPASPPLGYGLILIALATLLLSLTVGLHSSLYAVDLPQRPPSVRLAMTPEAVAQTERFLPLPTQSGVERGGPLLKNTPVPNLIH